MLQFTKAETLFFFALALVTDQLWALKADPVKVNP
jgi:hypothetical protein